MRGILICFVMLLTMALVDVWFTDRVQADVNVLAQATGPNKEVAAASLVEDALNSRYMQWGAVGVMLGLFTWLIVRYLPAQDQRRDKVIKEVIERSDKLARETRDTFLKSLETRDNQYLACLREIRESAERQSDRAFEQKDKLTEAFNNIAVAMRRDR